VFSPPLARSFLDNPISPGKRTSAVRSDPPTFASPPRHSIPRFASVFSPWKRHALISWPIASRCSLFFFSLIERSPPSELLFSVLLFFFGFSSSLGRPFVAEIATKLCIRVPLRTGWRECFPFLHLNETVGSLSKIRFKGNAPGIRSFPAIPKFNSFHVEGCARLSPSTPRSLSFSLPCCRPFLFFPCFVPEETRSR